MLNYLVLKNEKGDPSKGQYIRSKEGELVGDLPGWGLLFDPKFINEKGDIRNRVERNTFVSSRSLYTVKQSGENALLLSTEAIKAKFQPDLKINVDEWTAFFVCAPYISGGSIPLGVFRTIGRDIEDATQKGMNISFLTTAETLRIYRNGSNNPGGSANAVLSAAVPPEKIGQLAGYMVTFSVTDGYKVYCDGILIGRSTNVTPINFGFNPGEWELFPDFVGEMGLSGLLSVDLSKDEYAQYRSNLWQLINQRYFS